MTDRSSRPHHSPRRTPTRTERRIIKVRVLRRWGPARIAYLLGLNPSTEHRVLTRYRLARLQHLDRATGRVVRRYEHDAPGDLVHVDIKKLGNIPDGGGHKIHGRAVGGRNSAAHRDPARPRTVGGRANLGYSYLHNAVDDHSRLAYSEILPDETKETAAAFWTRAQAWFTAAGITVQRVLTDNGSCYRSRLWRDTLAVADVSHRRTRPYRPHRLGPPPPAPPAPHPPPPPPLPAPDQRQGRTVQPHPARRMGLRPALPHRNRTPPSIRPLAARLQSPPRTLRTRRAPTIKPRTQPHGTEHLGFAGAAGATLGREGYAAVSGLVC